MPVYYRNDKNTCLLQWVTHLQEVLPVSKHWLKSICTTPVILLARVSESEMKMQTLKNYISDSTDLS